MKLFIWTRTLDHLQLHTWNAVQALLGDRISYILVEPENHGRKQQGWQAADISDLDVILMKKQGWWQQSRAILSRNPGAIHVFWGFWSERRLFPLIVYAVHRGIPTVVLNEHYSTSPVGYLREENPFVARLKVFLRPFLYRGAASLLKLAACGGRRACVFSLSPQAYDQYVRAGFDKETLFPFGYFVPKMSVPVHQPEQADHLRLVFVAALLKRKGLDIAIRAVQRLNRDGIQATLDVYGSGDPAEFMPPTSETVAYKGVIPTEQAQSVIAHYDALILPSRHDGWGVVVNESLLQGVPVIVSDSVGAKCLVEFNGAGLVFENENVEDLVERLAEIRESPGLMEAMCLNAGAIGKYILPEAAARYFLDALRFYFHGLGPRPQAIWCSQRLTGGGM